MTTPSPVIERTCKQLGPKNWTNFVDPVPGDCQCIDAAFQATFAVLRHQHHRLMGTDDRSDRNDKHCRTG